MRAVTIITLIRVLALSEFWFPLLAILHFLGSFYNFLLSIPSPCPLKPAFSFTGKPLGVIFLSILIPLNWYFTSFQWKPFFSKHSPPTRVTWELVKHVNSRASPQAYWIRLSGWGPINFNFLGPPAECYSVRISAPDLEAFNSKSPRPVYSLPEGRRSGEMKSFPQDVWCKSRGLKEMINGWHSLIYLCTVGMNTSGNWLQNPLERIFLVSTWGHMVNMYFCTSFINASMAIENWFLIDKNYKIFKVYCEMIWYTLLTDFKEWTFLTKIFIVNQSGRNSGWVPTNVPTKLWLCCIYFTVRIQSEWTCFYIFNIHTFNLNIPHRSAGKFLTVIHTVVDSLITHSNPFSFVFLLL